MPQDNPASYFARFQQKVPKKEAATQPLRQFVDLFLTDKAAENRSPGYIRELRRTLSRFVAFLATAVGKEPVLADLTLEAGKAFNLFEQDRLRWETHPLERVRIHARPVTAQNVQNVMRMLKVFASWLDREEWTLDDRSQPVNVLARLVLPKVERKEVRPLTPEEEATLAKACDDRTRDGCRRLALLLLYLDTGARREEIAGLRVADVDFERGRIHIRWDKAKGRKERSVEFGRKTERALKRYASVFRDPPLGEARPEDAFFRNPAGEPITGQGIYLMFKRLQKRAGVAQLYPHLLRHTSATRDIERGKSTREVQHRLGHSSVAVTERYAHIVERDAAAKRRDSHVDDLPIAVRSHRKDR